MGASRSGSSCLHSQWIVRSEPVATRLRVSLYHFWMCKMHIGNIIAELFASLVTVCARGCNAWAFVSASACLHNRLHFPAARKPILRNTSTADLATSSHGTGIVSPPNGAGGSSAGANNIGGSMLGALRGGNIAGKTIESAGLRGLSDAFLVAIERNGRTMHAVPPSEVLQAHDVLWFAGSADGVISLRKIPGAHLNAETRTFPSEGVCRHCVYVEVASCVFAHLY